jgi:hypothetical protein
MTILRTIHMFADSDGSFAQLPGDFGRSPQNTPRLANVTPQTDYDLVGDQYAVEFDSTGEFYVEFLDKANNPVSGIVLLVRGMSVQITAARVRVVAIRRAGAMRLTAGSSGARMEMTNSPSGLTETFYLYYPPGTNSTTGPAGWVTIPHPAGLPGGYLSYKPSPIGIAAVLGGSARRYLAGNTTPSQWEAIQYGFADVVNGTVVKYHAYYDQNNNGGIVGGTYSVDSQSYWFPAIIWWLDTGGTGTSAVTPEITLHATSSYTYKRTAGQTMFNFT